MDKIEIKVKGITLAEFMDANRALARRQFLIMTGIILLCVASVLITTTSQYYPYVVCFFIPIPVMAVIHEFSFHRAYRKGPFEDLEMDYTFDPNGWRLSVDGNSASVSWAETRALLETKYDVLLYVRVLTGKRRTLSSNLIPLHCINAEQKKQLGIWFDQSRAAIKAAHEEAKAKRKSGK